MIPSDIEKLKAEFGDREFTGTELALALGLKTWHGSGTMLKSLRRQGLAYQTVNGWRFGAPPDAPVKAEAPAPVKAEAPVQSPCATPPLVRIGAYYMHERMLHIVHMGQQDGSDAVRFYTSMIEIDPNTKHSRNKVINFVKARDPREYGQALAWLDSLAGKPHAADETALELAAELEDKLNAAHKEIAELKAKIEAIRGAL